MLDVTSLRQQFPALHCRRGGRIPIFLDGPGGTQVPQRVVDAMVHYLTTCNANHGGAFATSQESDRIVASAHEAMADLLNAPSPNEIVFGANMTTLTLHLSRALGRLLGAGDEIVVTRLDHDANVAPWTLLGRDTGAIVHTVDIHPEDCTLDLEDLRRRLSPRTRLVAVGCASNAAGTINDVRAITSWAHEVGAWVFLDAVHYAPHAPIDVQKWGCDFLACSAYKFFGPHVGVLWGKRELLEELPAYKLRPAPDSLPDRWMTGTQNHEGLAGVAAAVEYLVEVGVRHPAHRASFPALSGRRLDLHAGLAAIQEYEAGLSNQLLEGLEERPRFTVWGMRDRHRLAQRTPTIALTMDEQRAEQIAQHLAARQIYVWSGNMYALGLTERLHLEHRGGFVRIGLVHYNTFEEVDALLAALDEL
ncbi:MAG TPA: cysteine desulfurase-like protein [Gemmataceae bacterium]|nr:cysteine desulfurase-like protein [Gemmataceae bacterium]